MEHTEYAEGEPVLQTSCSVCGTGICAREFSKLLLVKMLANLLTRCVSLRKGSGRSCNSPLGTALLSSHDVKIVG